MKRIKSLAFMLIPALLITLSACSDGGSGNSNTGGGVTPSDVAVISITADAVQLDTGESASPTIRFNPLDATNKSYTMTSNDIAVATVDNSTGMITGVADGITSVTITSVDNTSASATITVTVSDVPVGSITANPSVISLVSGGESEAITVTVNPDNATDKTYTMASDDINIATIDESTRKVTGVASGSTTITITSNADDTKTATVTVNVSDTEIVITDLTLSYPATTLDVGATLSPTIEYTPDTTTQRSVTYMIDNATASIDADGVVTGVSAGIVKVTATSTASSSISDNFSITILSTATCDEPPTLGYDNVSGTWEIYNATGLVAFGSAVNNGDTDLNAKLVCNIVLAGNDSNQWEAIAKVDAYSGIFDGDNHTISGLYINNTIDALAGMFNYVSGGTIKNLGIINADITVDGSIGGIVFEASANTLISNVYVKDSTFESTTEFDGFITSSIAAIFNNSTLTGSYVDNVSIVTNDNSAEVGGLVARMIGASSIYASYANDVSVIDRGFTNSIGGIAGEVSAQSVIEGTFVTDFSLSGTGLPSASIGGIVPIRNSARVDNNYYVRADNEYNAIGDEPSHATTQRINSIQDLNNNIANLNNAIDNGISSEFEFIKIGDNEIPSIRVIDPRCADTSGIGYTDVNGVWEIYNANGMIALRSNLTQDAKLVCNIDLAGSESNQWIPIGTNFSTNNYKGSFDGNNYTISRLYINNDALNHPAGLFGYISQSVVKNLTISNANVTGKSNVGSIIGSTTLSSVENITIVNSIISGTDGSVGGVVGSISDTSSIVNASVIGGTVTGTDEASNVGGIVGNASLSQIQECSNTAVISGYAAVGGVVGRAARSSSVIDSYNTGNVTGTSGRIGGVAGDLYASTITASYNTGDVSGSSVIGGVVGISGDSSTISGSYNTGDLTATNGSGIGGIIGNILETTLSASYNIGNIAVANGNGGIVGSLGSNVIINDTYFIESASINNGLADIGQPSQNSTNVTTVGSLAGFKADAVVNALNDRLGANREFEFIVNSVGDNPPLILQKLP